MGVLAEMGFGPDIPRSLLIEPPDAVLAEAGALTPRPVIASAVMTAKPASLVAWWPEEPGIAASTLSRLRWMVHAANGEAWVVVDPRNEGGLTAVRLRAALAESGIRAGEERALSTGEVAVQLLP